MSDRHPLSPLLAPESIALVGASPNEGSFGAGMIQTLKESGFRGRAYMVNPKYQEIEGYPCFPSLSALPEAVDTAALGVASARIEQTLQEAVTAGIRSAVIFDSCYLPEDGAGSKLKDRLAAIAKAAAMPICGGNCMGFFHPAEKAAICGWPSSKPSAEGGIAFISHSGTTFGSVPDADPRLGYSLVVSSGQEFATTMADYVDYAVEHPATRAVALFLETVRDPQGFAAALEKAAARDIPVVALKVGRNETSARMAATHSGALAGNDAAYQALFERYGVIRVTDLYEFASTLTLLCGPRRVGPGGLAVIGDSGGERGMLVDLAGDFDVPFAQIGEATKARLRPLLAHGLEAENPLDAWGSLTGWRETYREGLAALMDDPAVAIGVHLRDLRDEDMLSEAFSEQAIELLARTEKPIALATNFSATAHRELALRTTRAGVPVLDGTRQMLRAVRHAMDYRDFRARGPEDDIPRRPGRAIRDRWGARLSMGGPLDEAESLELLAAYGVPVPDCRIVESAAAAAEAAEAFAGPVVLKTATPGILHKSDVGGVKLNLSGKRAVQTAYRDLARRLGPRVLIAPMAGKGVEIGLGMVTDPQFGPLVMIGAGGIMIELMKDRAFAIPPFGRKTARRLLDGLALRPLLDGKRGAPPADIARLCDALARFSVMAADLGEGLGEVDVNPLVAGPKGAIALDALVLPKAGSFRSGHGD